MDDVGPSTPRPAGPVAMAPALGVVELEGRSDRVEDSGGRPREGAALEPRVVPDVAAVGLAVYPGDAAGSAPPSDATASPGVTPWPW